jgi:sugar lactone lactonase YvrE
MKVKRSGISNKNSMVKLLSIVFIGVAICSNAQVVTTLAGSTTSGSADGTGTAASFYWPTGVVTDGSGNLFVADMLNYEIRKVVISTGAVTTLAGSTIAGSADGIGATAYFNSPYGLATDGTGNLYVADQHNNEIRKIVISTGAVSTLAGSTIAGSADGTGTAASFNWPSGVVTDGKGNLYVADQRNNEIRKIVLSSGVVTTLAGSVTAGSANGTGTAASFSYPTGIVADGNDNLYVADQHNNEIRKIVLSTGVVTTLAGSTAAGSANGTGTAAGFAYPTGVTIDSNGNIYVADQSNTEIRKIVISTGVVTTLAGSTTSGSANGTGTAASFYYPTGVAMDGSGNLYVADAGNDEIRQIVISPTEVNEIESKGLISIYPNPVNQILNVKFSEPISDATLRISDITGREISTVKAVQAISSLQIDISSLSAGIYFVSATGAKGDIMTEKFIKK